MTRNKKQCKNWIIGWYCILLGDIENKKEVHHIFYHQRKALIYQPMFCLEWCPKVWKILKCFKWKDLKSVEMKTYFILFNQYWYWKEYFDKIAINDIFFRMGIYEISNSFVWQFPKELRLRNFRRQRSPHLLDVSFEGPLTCWMSVLRVPSHAGCQFWGSPHLLDVSF